MYSLVHTFVFVISVHNARDASDSNSVNLFQSKVKMFVVWPKPTKKGMHGNVIQVIETWGKM